MGETNTHVIAQETELQELGYKQELPRTRGLFHILFMTISIMAVPYAIASPIATCLIGGGPVTMVWGWIFVSTAVLPLAFSLAEISSKYPTSGGAYYWCFRLASPKSRVWLSWIDGWLTVVGSWTVSLSVTFGATQLLISGVQIFRPDWVPSSGQTYLILLAITTFVTAPGVFFNDIMPLIDVLSAWCIFLGTIVIAISLSTKAAAGRRSAAFAFGHYDPSLSGWIPGWTFFIGLLPFAYTYCAIGMIASMAEEVRKPSTQVPTAIIWSVPIGALCGLVFSLPIVFTLPDVAALLASGQPIGIMFELDMGSKAGGFGMLFIVFLISIFCGISICCAVSRATWSFARDRGIPFPSTFSKVNKRLGDVPLNAYLLSTGIQLSLGLLQLGSTAAFNAIVSVAVMCLGASYTLPVAILLVNGRTGVEGSAFYMGKVRGRVVNTFAVAWVLFEIVLFSMPAVLPVTRVSMNYASVVFVGFALISAVWYGIGKKECQHSCHLLHLLK
ncbi:amino acid transporter [Amanita muscaria]